jgi:hypothetical protein
MHARSDICEAVFPITVGLLEMLGEKKHAFTPKDALGMAHGIPLAR